MFPAVFKVVVVGVTCIQGSHCVRVIELFVRVFPFLHVTEYMRALLFDASRGLDLKVVFVSLSLCACVCNSK